MFDKLPKDVYNFNKVHSTVLKIFIILERGKFIMAKKATIKETKTTVAEKAAVKADSQAEVKETKTAKTETKAAAPKAAKTTRAAAKETVKVEFQFGGKNTTVDSIVEAIKEAYKAEGNKAAIKTLDVYVQPENNVAYYVINGVEEGKSVNF